MHTIKLSGPVGDEHFNVRQVEDLSPGPVRAFIDSGGGCLLTGHAIYQALIEHDGEITTDIHRAGSAAVAPALAGDIRTISGSGSIFIHRSWGTTIGTSPTLLKAAEKLAEWDAVTADIYRERTGLPLDQIFQLMDAETSLAPTEAVKHGFAHEVIGPLEHVTKTRSLDRTALGCLDIEREIAGPVMSELRVAARPVAARNTDIDQILSKATPWAKIKPSEAGHALEKWAEAQRREQLIKQQITERLKRVINQGGRITWPLQMTWTCTSCNQINYGPPAQNRLATSCAFCAQTSLE